jgi:cyclic pyranopterin phosphate synthase
MADLTHIDASGQAHMVDVGDKPLSDRRATAEGFISLQPNTMAAIADGSLPKGDTLATARLAGIGAAKRCADLVPLCHPIPLDSVAVSFVVEQDGVWARASVRAHWRTGVEMEAFTAVSAALLTIYDMVKAVDRSAEIRTIRLLEKHGGASGSFVRG